VFLGDVPITVYETPGDQKFADTVLPFAKKSNVMLLANHGTVSFGETVEKAYWWTEILDAYCRILMLSRDLGRVTYLSGEKARELLDLKTKWGYSDARLTPELENCDICANDVFRNSWRTTGVQRKAFEPPPPVWPATASPAATTAASGPMSSATDNETLVQIITDRVLAALSGSAAGAEKYSP
jgi:L-fuculose-phosphate aldolase